MMRDYWISHIKSSVADLMIARNSIVASAMEIQRDVVEPRMRCLIADGSESFHRMFRITAYNNTYTVDIRWIYLTPHSKSSNDNRSTRKHTWVKNSVSRAANGSLKLHGVNGLTPEVTALIRMADSEVMPLIQTSKVLYQTALTYKALMKIYAITPQDVGYTRIELVMMAHGYNPISQHVLFFSVMGHPSQWPEELWATASKMDPVAHTSHDIESIPCYLQDALG